jgi:hypothetical protein
MSDPAERDRNAPAAARSAIGWLGFFLLVFAVTGLGFHFVGK